MSSNEPKIIHDLKDMAVDIDTLQKQVGLLIDTLKTKVSKEYEMKNKLCQISCSLDFVIKENALQMKSLDHRIKALESTIHAHRAMHEYLLGMLSTKKHCQCKEG